MKIGLKVEQWRKMGAFFNQIFYFMVLLSIGYFDESKSWKEVKTLLFWCRSGKIATDFDNREQRKLFSLSPIQNHGGVSAPTSLSSKIEPKPLELQKYVWNKSCSKYSQL